MKMRKLKFFLKGAGICVGSILFCFVMGLVVGVIYPRIPQIAESFQRNTHANDAKSETDMVKELSDLNVALKAGDTTGEVYVIKKMDPSVVDLKIKKQAQDFFNATYESDEDGTGIIFYQTYDKVYIVTNHHVVESAEAVAASINGGDYVNATLVGKDTNSNLAVLSISKQDLPKTTAQQIIVPNFGNSDDVSIGDPVIAIGNSFGDGNAATKGIVSAINKKVRIQNRYLNVIQTDAAINPGYNGGPLVNQYGDIIGINTGRISSDESIEGTGYSISSNDAKKVIEQIMNNEGTPFLGIHMSNITEEMAAHYNVPQLGVFVQDVVAGSSAADAGILPEDIITGFNGKPIFSAEQLIEEVKNCVVSETVEMKVIRHAKEPLTIKVALKANKDTSF